MNRIFFAVLFIVASSFANADDLVIHTGATAIVYTGDVVSVNVGARSIVFRADSGIIERVWNEPKPAGADRWVFRINNGESTHTCNVYETRPGSIVAICE